MLPSPTFLTANEAAALRPAANPLQDIFAADYAQAIARLVKLHAARGRTRLRVRVPPDLTGRVVDLLHEARYGTVTLKHRDGPSGRLIVRWPAEPEVVGKRGLSPAGPPRQQHDLSEFTHRLIAVLTTLGLNTPDRFEDVCPHPLLHERTRDLVAAQPRR